MRIDPSFDYRYRPVLRRLVDRFGSLGRKFGAGRQQFRADKLMETACRKTGLSDFGDPSLTPPLNLLCKAYEKEAQLTFAGRIATRHHLVQLLINRLHLTHTQQQNPEITAQNIERPIFVLGLPRSGTTLLHGLLAQDPGNRTPMTWEVMYPFPAPTEELVFTDPRIRHTDKQLGWLEHLAPGFKTIHPIGALLPQECIAITAHAFSSLEFHTTNNVPSYQNWFESQHLKQTYDFHRRFLQHLQWRHKRDRWVLKAPDHLRGLDALLDVYPDAIIIQTHRDPLQISASIASHATVIRAGFSDHIDPRKIAAEWSDYWAESLQHALASRRASQETQFIDVFYNDLAGDPLTTVAKIYERLAVDFSNTAKNRMADYLNANPQDKHGRHRYSLEEFGLDPNKLRRRYEQYYREFDV